MITALLLVGMLAQNTITLRIGTTSQTYKLAITMTLLCRNSDGSGGTPGQPISLAKGQSSTCTLTLDQPAPAGGLVVTPYSVDAPLVLSPATLTIPENQTLANITVSYP